MGAQEIEAKKRKRKHSSKKADESTAPKRHSNGVEKADKPRKKAKKEHTPEPEVEDVVAEASDAEEEEVEGDEDEAQLNAELKQIAKDAKKSKNADVDESGDEQEESANPNDLPLGTSMPTVEDPKLFAELKLSDRTMEAIKSMGFETMTEIQQKTIPPLLR